MPYLVSRGYSISTLMDENGPISLEELLAYEVCAGRIEAEDGVKDATRLAAAIGSVLKPEILKEMSTAIEMASEEIDVILGLDSKDVREAPKRGSAKASKEMRRRQKIAQSMVHLNKLGSFMTKGTI